jgi:hypothetical protein
MDKKHLKKDRMERRKWKMTLTMRMNGDQEGRARKLVVEIQGWVAPALPGALCAGVRISCIFPQKMQQNTCQI